MDCFQTYQQRCFSARKGWLTRKNKRIKALEAALADCISFHDTSDSMMQKKEYNWRRVLRGGRWNPSHTSI